MVLGLLLEDGRRKVGGRGGKRRDTGLLINGGGREIRESNCLGLTRENAEEGRGERLRGE